MTLEGALGQIAPDRYTGHGGLLPYGWTLLSLAASAATPVREESIASLHGEPGQAIFSDSGVGFAFRVVLKLRYRLGRVSLGNFLPHAQQAHPVGRMGSHSVRLRGRAVGRCQCSSGSTAAGLPSQAGTPVTMNRIGSSTPISKHPVHSPSRSNPALHGEPGQAMFSIFRAVREFVPHVRTSLRLHTLSPR
jgi:hypothetical protein